jgi:hypothetical protein
MLVILKIPVVYLCAVVWWAIRAEPGPVDGTGGAAALVPVSPPQAPAQSPDCRWRRRRFPARRPPVRPRPGRVAA